MPSNKLPYDEAVKVIHPLGLKSAREWKAWLKTGERPDAIPTKPDEYYRGKGWVSWGEWLGTGMVATNARNYLSFTKAKAYARTMGITDFRGWRSHAASGEATECIPSHPETVYADKWVSWGDFLGTDAVAPAKHEFLSYREARRFMRGLKLTSSRDFKEWAASGERPNNIPSNPNLYYEGRGWKGYADFLGLS